MSAEPGLRERKKQQTRHTIAEAAQRLFARAGFRRTMIEMTRELDAAEP